MDTAIQSSHRMAAASPMGDRGNSTHPSQAERHAGLQTTLREIRAKLAQGQELRPNLRTGAVQGERRYRGPADVDSRPPVQ